MPEIGEGAAAAFVYFPEIRQCPLDSKLNYDK